MPNGGKRSFLVEDEALVLLTLQDLMEDLGYEIVATAMDVDDALAKAQSLSFDVAVLDINLAGRRVDEVADLLARRGVPLVFATGYDPDSLPSPYAERIVVPKPYRRSDLQLALGSALSQLHDRRLAL